MSSPLVVMTVLMLLPLVPAAIIYLVLTPKSERLRAKQGNAHGTGKWGDFQFDFNLVGSAATYVVLLVTATVIYSPLAKEETKKAEALERAVKMTMQTGQAWQVEVPVFFKNAQNKVVPPIEHQMDQVNVTVAPPVNVASATTIRFWVIASNERFPTASFSATGQSIKPTIVDLNDKAQLDHNYALRKITTSDPVWIEINDAYAK